MVVDQCFKYREACIECEREKIKSFVFGHTVFYTIFRALWRGEQGFNSFPNVQSTCGIVQDKQIKKLQERVFRGVRGCHIPIVAALFLTSCIINNSRTKICFLIFANIIFARSLKNRFKKWRRFSRKSSRKLCKHEKNQTFPQFCYKKEEHVEQSNHFCSKMVMI